MTERLLQFIWRSQYFNHHELRLENGEILQILSPGELNVHQGPDFLWAAVRIGNTDWFGNIELHLLASGWKKHAHEADRHYNNVILHVVWENDLADGETGGAPDAGGESGEGRMDRGDAGGERNIPVLVLVDRVPKLLLGKYEEWMSSRAFVACEGQLGRDAGASWLGKKSSWKDGELWTDWKQGLLEERLLRKTLFIKNCLEQNRQHWEETAWWLMARNFGGPVNAGAFESIARSLPLSILARHRDRPEQLEALLFGQAGLLEGDNPGDYALSLRKEFRYLRSKYRLRSVHEPLLFLRMRPAGFPVLRLSQLGALLGGSGSWFARAREADSPDALKEMLAVKGLGVATKESIIINTFAPLLYAYGVLRGERPSREKALRWLEGTRAEKNSLLAGWARLGVGSRDAAGSQALLELKTRYCDVKRCLECAVGKALLGKTAV